MSDTSYSEEMNQSEMEDFFDEKCYCEEPNRDMLDLWFKQLKQEEIQMQEDRLKNGITPFLAIPTTVVQTIFYICEKLCQPPEVRYLTVELFDRFINNQFLMLAPKIWPTDNNNNNLVFENDNWKEISDRIKEQSLLRIMSCLALASKFVIFNKVVPLKKIQNFLRTCGLTFSIQTILASEMRVYKTLDYKLHFPNVLTHADLIIELIDLPTNIEKTFLHKLSFKVIDITYLHHQEIYHKLFYYSTGRWEKTYEERKEFLATESNNLFLAAAVVTTCTTFVRPDNQSSSLANEVASSIDKLTDIPSDDIIALASIITTIIFN